MRKFLEKKLFLRVDFSKNLLSWNLGGQQIVPRPFFSESSYKNRVTGKFPIQTDTSWWIFWGRKRDDLKNGQKLPKSIFSPLVPNHVQGFFGLFFDREEPSKKKFLHYKPCPLPSLSSRKSWEIFASAIEKIEFLFFWYFSKKWHLTQFLGFFGGTLVGSRAQS